MTATPYGALIVSDQSDSAYAHAAAAGSTVFVTGNAVLTRVVINSGAASATVTIYDGIDNTGRVVAVIDASAPRVMTYGVHLAKGLFAVVAGAPDVTLIYIPRL